MEAWDQVAGGELMFRLGQKIRSRKHPNKGIGTIKVCEQKQGTFVRGKVTHLLIRWPDLTVTAHVYPVFRLEEDWGFELLAGGRFRV